MTGELGAAAERTAGAADAALAGGAEASPSAADAVPGAETASGGTETASGGAETASGGAGTMCTSAPTGPEAATRAGAESDAEAGPQTGAQSGAVQGASGQARRSRRFLLPTKDTARPEGGGRAAPEDAPAPARQWPVLAVLLLVGMGLLMTALDVFRGGTLLVGLGLISGALLRWALPSVGMLAVRSRFTDMVTYGVLGAVIALLAMMAQPHPWLEIPFLDVTLHFTIS